MAARAGVTVEGSARLRRTLRAAGDDLQDLKERAHRPAAALVTGRARAEAPKRSGTLANSGRPGATKTAAIVRFGGARVPYAGPIHYGWPRRNIRPQPFITTAATRAQPAIEDLYQDAVNRILDRIKGI